MYRRFFPTSMTAVKPLPTTVTQPTALGCFGISCTLCDTQTRQPQQQRQRSTSPSPPNRRRHASSSTHRRSGHRAFSPRAGRSHAAAAATTTTTTPNDRATEIQRRYSRDAAVGPTASLGLRLHEEISARYAVAVALQHSNSDQVAAAAPTPSATGSNVVVSFDSVEVELDCPEEESGDFTVKAEPMTVVSPDGGTVLQKQSQKLDEEAAGRWADERLQEAAMYRDPRP